MIDYILRFVGFLGVMNYYLFMPMTAIAVQLDTWDAKMRTIALGQLIYGRRMGNLEEATVMNIERLNALENVTSEAARAQERMMERQFLFDRFSAAFDEVNEFVFILEERITKLEDNCEAIRRKTNEVIGSAISNKSELSNSIATLSARLGIVETEIKSLGETTETLLNEVLNQQAVKEQISQPASRKSTTPEAAEEDIGQSGDSSNI